MNSRSVFVMVATLVAVMSLAVATASPASASPGQGQEVHELEGGAAHGDEAHGDAAAGELGNSKGAALLFWVFALLSVAGSIFVITRRNLVAAVMGMVGTFFAVAALYAMLYAHFLAVIQVLVYAGAIMVLFVFVIMILNRSEEEPWALHGLAGKGLAGLALVYFVFRLGKVLWGVKDTAAAASAQLAPGATIDGHDFGSTKAVGQVLFTEYLFPFEAVSVVLLIAVVGAIAIARPSATAPEASAQAEQASES